MSKPLVSKYPLIGILETDDSAYAITDSAFKVTWYNQQFKTLINARRVKGKQIDDLLQLNEKVFDNISADRTKPFQVRDDNHLILISPLISKGKPESYFIKVHSIDQERSREFTGSDLIQQNLKFQEEQQNILTLVVKEKSLQILAGEILKKSIELSKSDVGLVVIFNDTKKLEFLIQDDKETIKNQKEMEREVEANFSFITKWLNVNKHSLLALNYPNNIGFNLTRFF